MARRMGEAKRLVRHGAVAFREALAAVLPQEAGAPPISFPDFFEKYEAVGHVCGDKIRPYPSVVCSNCREPYIQIVQLRASRAPSEAAPRAAFNIALGALNTISALPSGRPNEIDNAKYLATRGISDAMRAASRPEGDGA